MRFRNRRPVSPVIGLAPLVDVVFILLVFFMLSSSFLHWRAIEMAMPDQVAAEATAAEAAVVVGLAADGGLTLSGSPVAEGDLGAAVAQKLNDNADLRIVIRPAEDVSLQRAVTVLDLLDRAGVTGVSLARGR